MEDLCIAFENFNSSTDSLRKEAYEYINDQIENDPLFFIKIFNIYLSSTKYNHKELALILVKGIIKQYFDCVLRNMKVFTETLNNAIENTNDIHLFHNLSAIVYQSALNAESCWRNVPIYLHSYQNNPKFLPFCLYLYGSIFYDGKLQNIYKECLMQEQVGIIASCFQLNNQSIRFYTYKLFCKVTSNFGTNDQIPNEYQMCLCNLLEFAKQSNTLNEKDFDVFWASIRKLNLIFALPFFIIANTFLFGNFQNFDLNTKKILFQFILNHSQLIQKEEELVKIIQTYFTIQLEAEDIDQTSQIYERLQIIDKKKTYNIFKQIIVQFLTDQHPIKRRIALINLCNFIPCYMPESISDITNFVEAVIQLPIDNEDTVISQLSFIGTIQDFNDEDTHKVFNFILKVIVNCQHMIIQRYALDILMDLSQYPSFFDQVISICPHIVFEVIPFYFECIISIHKLQQIRNNLALEKYEGFLKVVFDLFNKSNEAINRIKSQPNFDDNSDLQNQMYFNLLLRGSSGNVIFYFSFFNPIKLGKYVKQIIELFIQMMEINFYLKIERSAFIYNIYSIERNFAFICQNFKRKSIGLIGPYYDNIVENQSNNYFQGIFIKTFGDQCSMCKGIISVFDQYYKKLKSGNFEIDEILYQIDSYITPMANWLYKIPVHKLHANFIDCIKYLLALSLDEAPAFETLCMSMLCMIKPVKIAFNQKNKWFRKIVKEIDNTAVAIVNNLLPKVPPHLVNSFFSSFVYLMKIFISLNEQFGHTFFGQVMNCYQKNKGNTENAIMQIFVEMLKNKYCNDQEKIIIEKTVKEIFDENSSYRDNSGDLFFVFYYLAKENQNVFVTFLQHAENLFTNVKDDPSKTIIRESYSLFIFSAFVANPEAFKIPLPILHQIFELFPMGHKTIFNLFINELLELVTKKKQALTIEIMKLIMEAIVRYLSFQECAPIILKISDEKHLVLVNLFKALLQSYLQNDQSFNIKEFVESCLPGHMCSIQYILQQLASQ